MTVITFMEMPTEQLKEMTLNIEELTPFGRFLLNGKTTAVVNGQFIDLYLDGKRYFQYGFNYYKDEEYYGEDGLIYVKEGFELIG